MPKFEITLRRLVPETARITVEADSLEAAMNTRPGPDDYDAWDVEEGLNYSEIPSEVLEVSQITETVVFKREEAADA